MANFWDPRVLVSTLASRELGAFLLFKAQVTLVVPKYGPHIFKEKTFSFTFHGFVQIIMPPASPKM